MSEPEIPRDEDTSGHGMTRRIQEQDDALDDDVAGHGMTRRIQEQDEPAGEGDDV
jgi:hypothetical protein